MSESKSRRARRESAMQAKELISTKYRNPPVIFNKVRFEENEALAVDRHIRAVLNSASKTPSSRKPSMPKMPWDKEDDTKK